MLASKRNENGAFERIGRLWCLLMHDSPMWPIHGHYECRVCGLQHAVPWAEAPSETHAQPRGGTLRIHEVRAA